MKSIFKRCCLTHTYLSRYVKTSNEDKYHRGAKSFPGKWIPEWRHPLVPDAMPYGIGQSGRSEQCRRGARAGQTYQRVMHWVKRFQSDGIAGLKNKAGNGRKRIISTKKDKEAVREAIRQHRQSVSKARAAWEEATGKKIKDGAFRNFLSSMAQDLDV